MSRKRQLCCLALSMLVIAGCISNPSSSLRNPLGSFVTYATFRIQLIDGKTQQPIPGIKIMRLDPVVTPQSFWGKIMSGEADYNRTLLATTDQDGFASLPRKDKTARLECHLPLFATLDLNCETLEATYNHGLKRAPEPKSIKIEKVEPDLLQVIVPCQSD